MWLLYPEFNKQELSHLEVLSWADSSACWGNAASGLYDSVLFSLILGPFTEAAIRLQLDSKLPKLRPYFSDSGTCDITQTKESSYKYRDCFCVGLNILQLQYCWLVAYHTVLYFGP